MLNRLKDLLRKVYTDFRIFAKLVNLCKFTAWCLDVLSDKPHPRFDPKILSKKVRLIRRCLQYMQMIR